MTDASSAAAPGASLPAQDSGPGASSWLSGSLPDRMNPVLVKELRQAQRGKVFAIALVVTLVFALLGAAMSALRIEDQRTFSESSGPMFFQSVYFFLNVAVLVVVPFQAFVSMGAERDDNTMEMLVLSNLKPRQIVMGKVLAALAQGLVFGLAFLPFVVTAFLLRGIDLETLLLVLLLTAFACAVLTNFAVMLSAVVQKRILRVLTMVALAGGLFMLVPFAGMIAGEWFRRPEFMAEPEFYPILLQCLAFVAAGSLMVFAVACNMMAHEEENRSTNIRLAVTALCVIGVGTVAYDVFLIGGRGMPREAVYGVGTAGLFLLTFFCLFFVLEPERLGRRVAPAVPRSSLRAMLFTPWLPGAGRALAFSAVHIVAVVVSIIAIGAFAHTWRFRPGPASTSGHTYVVADHMTLALLATALYCALYTLVPAVLLGGMRRTGVQRNVARFLALLIPLVLIIAPAVVGLFLGLEEVREFRHFGNPFWVIDEVWDQDQHRVTGSMVFIGGVTALLGLMSLRRIGSGFAEVQRARVEARADGAAPGS